MNLDDRMPAAWRDSLGQLGWIATGSDEGVALFTSADRCMTLRHFDGEWLATVIPLDNAGDYLAQINSPTKALVVAQKIWREHESALASQGIRLETVSVNQWHCTGRGGLLVDILYRKADLENAAAF